MLLVMILFVLFYTIYGDIVNRYSALDTEVDRLHAYTIFQSKN